MSKQSSATVLFRFAFGITFLLVGVISACSQGGTTDVQTSAAGSPVPAEVERPVSPTQTSPDQGGGVAFATASTTAETFAPAPTAAAPRPTPTREPEPTATATGVPAAAPVEAGFTLLNPAPGKSFEERVWENAVALAEMLSPRESATDEELAAAEFLANEFKQLGYEVEISSFEVTDGFPIGAMRQITDDSQDEPLSFDTFAGPSPFVQGIPVEPIVVGEATGELVFVGRATDSEVALEELDGKVALAEYGTIPLEEKHANVVSAGAIALVIFDEVISRQLRWDELSVIPDIPMFNVRRIHGLKLIDAIDSGEEIVINAKVERLGNGPSRNVIAELENDIEDDDVVVLGAHYDTTPESAGANDNGTGLAVLSVVAQELADDDLPFDLRFILFGSEETGLHGSNSYVANLSRGELSRIDAMINVDSVGLGDIVVDDTGSLAEMTVDVAYDLGIHIDIEKVDYAASDHAAFMEEGVDVVFIYGDDMRFINSPQDILRRIDAEPLGDAIEVVMGLIDALVEQER